MDNMCVLGWAYRADKRVEVASVQTWSFVEKRYSRVVPAAGEEARRGQSSLRYRVRKVCNVGENLNDDLLGQVAATFSWMNIVFGILWVDFHHDGFNRI